MPRFEVAFARKVELHGGEVGTDSGAAGSASLMGALSSPPSPRRCPAAPRLSEDVPSSLIYALTPDGEASLKGDAEWRHALTRAYMCSH